jgi:hypothetical protein
MYSRILEREAFLNAEGVRKFQPRESNRTKPTGL